MNNNFANLTSLGLVSTIIGIVSIGYASSRPFVSFLVALIGILFGILSLRFPNQEKLEKWSSWFGIVLSVVSIVWVLVNVYLK